MDATPTPSAEPLLQLTGVAKAYGKAPRPFYALRDIDLRIAAGEFVCIVGPSGCGKSTLLRIIADLNAPSAGEIVWPTSDQDRKSVV